MYSIDLSHNLASLFVNSAQDVTFLLSSSISPLSTWYLLSANQAKS